MTMADRRRDASDNSSLEHIDPRCADIQKKSTTSHEHRHDTDKKYDGRNSSGPLTTDSQIDDSSTCIPTAATATPPHPYLDSVDPDQTPDLRGSVSPVQLPHSSTYFVAVTTDTIYKTPRAHTELSMSTSHLRQLPLFNSPTSPGRAIQGETPINPQPLLESYDANQVQSYCESNNEDEDYIKLHTRGIYSAPQIRSSDQSFDVRNQHNVQSLYLKRDVDTDAGEKTFDTLKKWREFSEIQPRESQDNDESFLGACGGSDSECCALSAHAYEICDGEYQSLHMSSRESDRLSSGKTTARENDIKYDFRNENSLFMRVEDSLTCSQGFQPGYFDTDAKDSDSGSVFAADTDDIDDHEDTGTSYITQVTRDLSVSQERESPDTVASPRRRRVGVIRPHEFPREICQSTSSFGVSVSTQTPHVTSIMIQQIMDMPVPLPNEARGTVASRLRRLSESGLRSPWGRHCLPDIIPDIRDRSRSVPELQFFRTQRVREMGQVLRRVSDEFNSRRNLNTVGEEIDGHPASDPQTRQPRYLQGIVRFIRNTLYGRESTPVDSVGNPVSVHPPEESWNAPGD